MAKQRYKNGETVYFEHTKSKGTIFMCINADEPGDVAAQGYRYYVDMGAQRWSISEKELRPVAAREKYKSDPTLRR